MDDLLKYFIKDKKTLVFDCETNSLNLYFARPFDITFMSYEGYNKVEEKQFYIKWPHYEIDEGLAEKVHYNKQVIDKVGIEPKRAMEIVNGFINDNKYDILAGNNILGYDSMVFYNSCKEVGVNMGYQSLKKIYDCNAIFKGMKRNLKPDYDNFLSWQLSQNNFVAKGLKSSVAYICGEFDIPYNKEELHGSYSDTVLSSKIFFELVKRLELK
jgi:DNA polymerase III epsilon subunit-like protein